MVVPIKNKAILLRQEREKLMAIFLKLLMYILLMLLVTQTVCAGYESDWMTYKKTCTKLWHDQQKGRHRHITMAVCSCIADMQLEYQLTHATPPKKQDGDTFYKQASELCTVSGVLANTVDRAIFDEISDESTVEGLCTSSWSGLMGSFHPADKNFNSSTLCHCASAPLTHLVTQFETMTPRELRLQSLAVVKKCDPSAALSPEQFSLLTKSAKPQAVIAPSTQGKFILEIKDDPKYQDIATYLRKNGRLTEIVAALNQNLKIPYDIKIVVSTTNSGHYYLYEDKTIYLDYAFMRIEQSVYDKYHANESVENKNHYFNNLNRFFLYHELGHALIDAYQLPVLGQQEDAADALGAVIALKYLPKGFQVLVDSADFFYLLDKVLQTTDSFYWDEHALNSQRYYRLLCFAYGKAPQPVLQKIKYYYKGALDAFIKERSGYCQDEYDTTYHSWMRFLEPYLNQNVNQGVKPH